MTSVSLGYCIRWAYGIRDYQLIGPDWVVAANLAHYDIGAVTSEPSSEDRLKALSRTLLAQRFGLEMHQETRSIPMFALRVVKDGPKFSKAPDDENAGILPAGPYAFAAHNTTMARLAEILASPWTSRPVIDETGLPGGYDFHLDLSRYVTDEQTRQPVPGPNGGIDMESATMVSLPDQLGLRLVPTHAPTDVLIVDRANKDPAEN
jgi:uncharacterized protein (TIGR03435 family)